MSVQIEATLTPRKEKATVLADRPAVPEYPCTDADMKLVLSDSRPHADMYRALADMYATNELCDVTIVVSSQRFECHRVVLASASRYFRTLFSSGMRDARERELVLQDVDETTFGRCLTFVYHGDVAVKHSDMTAILHVASRFEFSSLLRKCIELFTEQLAPDTAIVTHELADTHGIPELAERAKAMMCSRFFAVAAHPSFADMSPELLLDLVGSDALRAKEPVVLDAVLNWVRANEEARGPVLGKLLPLVRFPLMSVQYISDTVYSEPLVTAQPCWDKLALEAYRFQTTAASGIAKLASPRTVARGGCSELYAVGGQVGLRGEMNQGRVEGVVSRFCPERGTWEVVPPMRIARSKAGLAAMCSAIYCAGGSTRMAAVSDVLEEYCPVRDTWETLAPMSTPRSGVGVGVLEDKLYAVGGTDGVESALASVERFDAHVRTWEPVPPMHTSRLYAGVAVLDGKLYAVGGWEGAVDRAVASVERYSPSSNEWEAVAPMSVARSAAGVAVLDGQLYAVGGGDGASRWRTVERFCPRRRTWQRVAPMSTARSNLGVAVLDGMLYAVGGWDGTVDFSSAERYNPQTDEWEQVQPLAEGRRGLRCCVAPTVQ